MTLSQSLYEHIAAAFTGLWVQSYEHEDALAEIARLCSEHQWSLAVWGGVGVMESAGINRLGIRNERVLQRRVSHRHSVAKRIRATLQAIKAKLRKRMHRPLGETARWLRSVVQGWLNYHAVPNNGTHPRRQHDHRP